MSNYCAPRTSGFAKRQLVLSATLLLSQHKICVLVVGRGEKQTGESAKEQLDEA